MWLTCEASCFVWGCRVQRSTMSRRWCRSWRRTRSCSNTSDCWRTGCTTQTKTAHLLNRYYIVYTWSNLSIFSDRQYPLSFCLVSLLKGSFSAVIRDPASCSTSNPPGGPKLSHSHISGYNPSPSFFSASSSPEAERQGKSQSSGTPLGALGDSRQEVQDLKEQLEALRCQVGCSLKHSIKKKCSHFWCDESWTDVNSLLPGEDLLNA